MKTKNNKKRAGYKERTGNKRWKFLLLSLMLAVQAPLTYLAVQKPVTALAAAGDAEGTFQTYQAGTALSAVQRQDYVTIEISTEEELAVLAENCRLDSWSRDKLVVLKNDIVLQEHKDISIPAFGGSFEGNGYKIAGLWLETAGSAQGLFRYLQEGAVVQNLSVEGSVKPEGSQNQVGGIVGVNYGKILNCSFRGAVNGDSEVGGIAGVNMESGEIRSCSTGATVIGKHSTGGIVGSNHGILNNCKNTGDINTFGEDISYELEDISDIRIENLEDLNSTENLAAHTDTGGIAGISDGKIYYCSNTGKVGYQHVGYNVGGIVGRLHQGYLQSCTNTGAVLGRKDAGGIAGQMEPFLEVVYLTDKLQQLDRETEVFLDLLDAAQGNMRQYGNQASQLIKSISSSLKSANGAGNALLSAADETWYIFNQELSGISNDIKTLNEELQGSEKNDTENGNNTDKIFDDSVSFGDISVSSGNLDDYLDWNNPGGNGNLESYKAALRKFGDSASGHIDKMTSSVNGNSEEVRENLDTLNRELDAAGANLEKLSDILIEASDTTGSDMDALVAQARVLRQLMNEIRDDLFRYEGITVEDTSDEASTKISSAENEAAVVDESLSEKNADADEAIEEDTLTQEVYYDTESFQQGKITHCVNRGAIEADTNVGGIVGQVATEYDLDPEEDITFNGTESFDIERTVKAVVRDSQNFGRVTAKKDYAGGVAGKAEFGAVISCESYSEVSSTSGSYVGGIAGGAGYAVRSCYSMGGLSGKNYIGGIVGMGCDIFDCYAYNELEVSGEWAGAIAGNLKSGGTLHGNYYVPGELGGVDNIGYEGGAAPMSYEELCSQSGIPEAFRSFTVIFMADGKELASYQCRYGDAIPKEQIPKIPEKEGYYGVWENFDFDYVTSNAVLEAQYEKWVPAVASSETDEDGKARLMVGGEFLPGTELEIVEEGMTVTFRIWEPKEPAAPKVEYAAPIQVRVLCEDVSKAQAGVKNGETYEAVPASVKGSYLVFEMDSPGTFRVTYPERNTTAVVAAAACAAVGIVVLVLVIRAGRRAAGRKRRKAEENREE